MTKKAILIIGSDAAGNKVYYKLRDVADSALMGLKRYSKVSKDLLLLLVKFDELFALIRGAVSLGLSR